MQWHKGSYTRMSYFLEPDDYILLVQHTGEKNFKRIVAREPTGAMLIEFANSTNPLNSGEKTNEFECDFLEPRRQDRLFQIRPSLLMVVEDTGRREIGPANIIAGIQYFIADIYLYIQHPVGSKRLGTDISQTVEITVGGSPHITQTLGGVGRGILSAVMLPFVDDMTELYDIWTYFGAYPSFIIENNTNINLGNENFEWPSGSGLIYNLKYFLALVGMKYLLVDVTPQELELLKSRELDYIGVTIPGVDIRTTKL